jgi:hypothetical protein
MGTSCCTSALCPCTDAAAEVVGIRYTLIAADVGFLFNLLLLLLLLPSRFYRPYPTVINKRTRVTHRPPESSISEKKKKNINKEERNPKRTPCRKKKPVTVATKSLHTLTGQGRIPISVFVAVVVVVVVVH